MLRKCSPDWFFQKQNPHVDKVLFPLKFDALSLVYRNIRRIKMSDAALSIIKRRNKMR